MMKRNMKFLSQRGFSLLEVVIAIAIFAIGMLALASMQGSLTRSSADGNLRAVATNIAERTLENLRGFGRIDFDPNPDPTLRIPAYASIVDTPSEEVWAAENSTVGFSFIRTIEVTDYYYVIANDNFSTTAPTGIVVPDFKMVEVNVSWGGALEDNAGFQLDESQDALSSSDLGSGEITLSTMISSITTQGSARVSAQGDGSEWEPFVSYTPGERPDIVPVTLGGDIYKESLLPEPDVTRDDELIETRFDVITYSQAAGELVGQFVRREEFAVVSCDCTFATVEGGGRRPVIWAGDEYVRGQFVPKTTGVSANSQQSSLCVTCCRDHHDGGSSTEDHDDGSVNVYDPFNKPGSTSNHDHYARTRNGLEVVTTGDYVEACRLVRQDGFFRVAQDFRREDLNIFPADFFSDPDGNTEIQTYSNYVADAVPAYVNAVGANYPYITSHVPCIGPSGCVVVAPKGTVNETLGPTELPSWTSLTAGGFGGTESVDQQLRSRGVYMDYVSTDLRVVLTGCTGSNTADDAACKFGDVELDRTGHVNPLELIPFFDVQMTKLNRWNEAPANIPVETTNEPLESNNTHSRGIISKQGDGGSTVVSTGHRGNLGFTDSFPIDTLYSSLVASSDIFVDAGSGTSAGGTAILGSLSHTLNGNPDIMVTGSDGVECGQTTVDYGCTVLLGATNPQIIISGYGKDGRTRYACSIGTPLLPDDTGTITVGEFAEAIFNLVDEEGNSVPAGTTYNFIVQEDVPCP